MADDVSNPGGGKGLGDIGYYLVQRFPVFGAAVVLLVLGFYGFTAIVEQKDKAEKELQEAREKIESDRKISRAETDRQKEAAATSLAAANEKLKQAEIATAKAKGEALLTVQNTLTTAAERIQKLVLGQLESMENLEGIRKITTEELQREVNALEERRAALQKDLVDAKKQIKLAGLKVRLDGIANKIEHAPYQINSDLDWFIESFDDADSESLSELENYLTQKNDNALRAAVQYAMAAKTNDPVWAQRFVDTFKAHGGSLRDGWLSGVFGCCRDLSFDQQKNMADAVADFIANDSHDLDKRIDAVSFFTRRHSSFNPLLDEQRYRDTPAVWRVMHFLVSVAQGVYTINAKYQYGSVARALARFHPAVVHVWGPEILEKVVDDEETRSDVERTLERLKKRFPALTSPPPARISAFWKRDNLSDDHMDFATQGTSDAYRPADP